MKMTTTFTTDFLFTGQGPALPDQFVTLDSRKRILATGPAANAPEVHHHYAGAICPGFINAHIHTELSHIDVVQSPGSGMAGFIEGLSSKRHLASPEERVDKISLTIKKMWEEGVNGAGDICNETVSFTVKAGSPVHWYNFIESFGTDKDNVDQAVAKALKLKETSEKLGFRTSVTPHATYSVCEQLYRSLKEQIRPADLLSYHFMESSDESEYFENRSGALARLFFRWGIKNNFIPEKISSPVDQLISGLPHHNRLMLVHNTFINETTIKTIQGRFADPWFCLCPQSNLTISGKMPPVELLRFHSSRILIGTDSRASNASLSVLEEIRTIRRAFGHIPLHEIIGWATYNGARFFGWDQMGTITPGMTPGLVWLKGLSHPDEPMPADVTAQRIA